MISLQSYPCGMIYQSNFTIGTFGCENVPPALTGDMNNDGEVDLKDAVIALQLLTRIVPSELDIKLQTDCNSDSKIGMEEIVFILQKTGGIRD